MKLKLNGIKTEFIVLLSTQQLKKYGRPENIMVDCAVIKSVMSLLKLGAHFDIHLSVVSQVSAICRKCNFSPLRNASIRAYISKAVYHRLTIALVAFNLDCCNALQLDIPGYLLRRPQAVHRAARLVTLPGSRDHITPVMGALHWLPVNHRIIFKMLLYSYV